MTAHQWRLAPPPTPEPTPVLDGEQERAVAWASGPALLLGGPGTGKTTVLLEAALRRMAEGAPADAVLVLTGGREAVADLRRRFALRLGGAEPPQVATFHGFALALAQRAADAESQVRLLSGAEQERAVREVIAGPLEDPALRGDWPPELREAVATRGFAREARAAFAAARALGLTGDEVARIGRRAGDAAWGAIGPVLDEYLESQAQQGALDYSELMFRAVTIAHDPQYGGLLSHVQHVYVDEYQEVDVMQVALLRELSRTARSLIAAADPDQAVFGFRGGDVRHVRGFHDHFQAMAIARGLAEPATLPLRTSHRFGRAVRDYLVGVFDRVAPAGLTGDLAALHRVLRTEQPEGSVSVQAHDDALAEAAWIASGIRDLVQASKVPWERIAVITRSVAGLGPIERALRRAGIPCTSDVRDGRLADQPAVATLLRALEAVTSRDATPSPTLARDLLLSPMAALDPVELRSIGRALRAESGAPSDQAIAQALMADHPVGLDLDPSTGIDRFEALRALLQRARSRTSAGATPHEVLWVLWSGTAWPERLRRQAVEQGSELAHRDLDAVAELFDVADRAVQRRHGHAGVSAFLYELRAQEVPSETLARRGYRGPAVELLTAHRAKGREWDHVFVAAVNDGVWPNLRRRSALLDTDRLTRDELIDPPSRAARFDEERRLFYLACARARQGLHVSGVVGDDGATGTSRFLSDGAEPLVVRRGRPSAVDSAASLVAELRRVATAPESSVALRDAALARLRSLARAEAAAVLFPEAQPARWWGVRDRTHSPVPLDDPGAALYVRGSSLDTLTRCSLAWFLQQRARAESTRGSAVVFGSAIHALIDGVTKGHLPPDPEVLLERLRTAWNEAAYDAPWQSARDLEQAARALQRFLAWHAQRRPAVALSEVEFDEVVEVPTPAGGTERLRMRGTIDRLELLDDGSAVVFDFKTSRAAPTVAEAREHAQLQYYQYAIERGLLDAATQETGLRPGGGQLVFLRLDASSKDSEQPKALTQPAFDAASTWPVEVLGAGLARLRAESFEATSGAHCTLCSMRSVCPLQPEGRSEEA